MGQNPQHITIESLLLVTALSSMPCEQDLPTQCVCKSSKLNFLFEETRVVNQGKSKQGKNANRSRGNKNHTCMAIYYRCKDSTTRCLFAFFQILRFGGTRKGLGLTICLQPFQIFSLLSQSHWTFLGLLKSILF